jgi:hypothetical protein
MSPNILSVLNILLYIISLLFDMPYCWGSFSGSSAASVFVVDPLACLGPNWFFIARIIQIKDLLSTKDVYLHIGLNA